MSNLAKTNIDKARQLNYTFRYLDDLLTLNLDTFDDLAKDIYPEELVLVCSNADSSQDCFLDLKLKVSEHLLDISIYHKVDDFNFDVISFPFPDSNISLNIGYNTFYSQLIRFAKLCSGVEHFTERANLTYSKLRYRGYNDEYLLRTAHRFQLKYSETLADKFGIKSRLHLEYIPPKLKSGVPVICVNESDNSTDNTNTDDLNYVHNNYVPVTNVNVSNSTSYTSQSREVVARDVSIAFNNFGFFNHRNNCYMISVLNCLIAMEDIMKPYTPADNSLALTPSYNICYNSYNGLLAANQSTRVSLILAFKRYFGNIFTQFNNELQQDAHEFFVCLRDLLDESTKIDLGIDGQYLSVIKSCFTGCISLEYRCNSCEITHSRQEYFNELFFELFNNMVAAFKHWASDSKLLFCHGCGTDRNHTVTNYICSSPQLLTIIFNRFDRHLNKNNRAIILDSTINLYGFSGRLKALVCHHGNSINSGHYTAFVKVDNHWLSCNDNKIAKVDFNDFKKSSGVYIVFYTNI